MTPLTVTVLTTTKARIRRAAAPSDPAESAKFVLSVGAPILAYATTATAIERVAWAVLNTTLGSGFRCASWPTAAAAPTAAIALQLGDDRPIATNGITATEPPAPAGSRYSKRSAIIAKQASPNAALMCLMLAGGSIAYT